MAKLTFTYKDDAYPQLNAVASINVMGLYPKCNISGGKLRLFFEAGGSIFYSNDGTPEYDNAQWDYIKYRQFNQETKTSEYVEPNWRYSDISKIIDINLAENYNIIFSNYDEVGVAFYLIRESIRDSMVGGESEISISEIIDAEFGFGYEGLTITVSVGEYSVPTFKEFPLVPDFGEIFEPEHTEQFEIENGLLYIYNGEIYGIEFKFFDPDYKVFDPDDPDAPDDPGAKSLTSMITSYYTDILLYKGFSLIESPVAPDVYVKDNCAVSLEWREDAIYVLVQG
jgi:hypothetical protein